MASALRTKGSMTPVDAAVGGDAQVLQVFIGQGQERTPRPAPRCSSGSRPGRPGSTVQWRAVSAASARKSSLPSSGGEFLPPGLWRPKGRPGRECSRVPRNTCCPSESVSGDRQPPDAQLRALLEFDQEGADALLSGSAPASRRARPAEPSRKGSSGGRSFRRGAICSNVESSAQAGPMAS